MDNLYLEDQVPKCSQSREIINQRQEHQELEFIQKASNRERFPGFEGARSPREGAHGTHVWSPQRNLRENAPNSDERKFLQKGSENAEKEKRRELKKEVELIRKGI